MMMAEDEDLENENEDSQTEGEDGEEEEEGKKSPLILIIVGVVILLLGGGAAAYFTGMLDGMLGKDKAAAEEDHAEGEDGEAAHGEEDAHGEDMLDVAHDEEGSDDHGEKGDDGHGGKAKDGMFIEMPKMIVNLQTDDGVPRYLRLSLQLELKDPKDAPKVEAVIPRVVDRFQTYLRELRVQDLRGSGGIYRLQMELLWRVNQAAAPVEVKDVLFQEILVQ